jgi:hypothetical protein
VVLTLFFEQKCEDSILDDLCNFVGQCGTRLHHKTSIQFSVFRKHSLNRYAQPPGPLTHSRNHIVSAFRDVEKYVSVTPRGSTWGGARFWPYAEPWLSGSHNSAIIPRT